MAYKSNTSFIKGIKSFTVQTYHYAVSLTKDHLVKQVAFEDTSPQEINQGSVFVSFFFLFFFMFQCKSVSLFFNYIHQTFDLSILSQFPALQ